MMELRHLRYFVAIAEERSFTRAAERLWVAQPGLSTQIRRLEAELGVQLFDRHTRGVDLTPAGDLFLERARLTLAAAEAAGATGSDLAAGVSGALRLGLATWAHWSQAPLLLERFTRERPGVELTVLEALGGTLWRDLRDGRLDAIVVPSTYASADLASLALGSEAWVVLVGAPHKLAGDGALDAIALDGQRISVTGHRDGHGYDRAVAQLVEELGIAAALAPSPPGPALDSAVRCGDTLALTTAPASVGLGVSVRALEPRRELGFELLWRNEALSPALDAFIRTARECVVADPVPVRELAAVA
jgi:DNA-binding transcriptional LysR family regulator